MVITETHVEPLEKLANASYLPVTGVLGHVDDLVFADFEGLLQRGEDLVRGRVLLEVVAAQVLLHLALDVERQAVLEEAGDLAPILTVAIAD